MCALSVFAFPGCRMHHRCFASQTCHAFCKAYVRCVVAVPCGSSASKRAGESCTHASPLTVVGPIAQTRHGAQLISLARRLPQIRPPDAAALAAAAGPDAAVLAAPLRRGGAGVAAVPHRSVVRDVSAHLPGPRALWQKSQGSPCVVFGGSFKGAASCRATAGQLTWQGADECTRRCRV